MQVSPAVLEWMRLTSPKCLKRVRLSQFLLPAKATRLRIVRALHTRKLCHYRPI